jgi:geranylgeranyl pyrophosphate synthase
MCESITKYFERGKMLRAKLVFIAASAVGGNPDLVTLAAEAIELLHGASLVHDDIIDQASERRSVPTLHTQFGTGTALALGDYLLFRAFVTMVKACASLAVPARELELLAAFSAYGEQCCRGQIAELGEAGNIESEEEYLSMARWKTGSLFALAAVAGATLGGGTLNEISALHTFGINFGVSFQIYDDVLELTGKPQELGKSLGRSFAQRRPLLPLIYLVEYGTRAARAEYNAMHRCEQERKTIVTLLEREGIFTRIKRTQDYHIATALNALNELSRSDDILALRALIQVCGIPGLRQHGRKRR